MSSPIASLSGAAVALRAAIVTLVLGVIAPFVYDGTTTPASEAASIVDAAVGQSVVLGPAAVRPGAEDIYDDGASLARASARLVAYRSAPHSAAGGSRTFHTVQSAGDESRLLSGGTPWPSGPTRAHLGEGVYSWGNKADAEAYLNHLSSRGACDLTICSFQVKNADLAGMRHLDVDSLANPSGFMQKHSSLWGGTPNHGYDYVTRGTNFGTEHFFSSSVFDKLRFGGA